MEGGRFVIHDGESEDDFNKAIIFHAIIFVEMINQSWMKIDRLHQSFHKTHYSYVDVVVFISIDDIYDNLANMISERLLSSESDWWTQTLYIIIVDMMKDMTTMQ